MFQRHRVFATVKNKQTQCSFKRKQEQDIKIDMMCVMGPLNICFLYLFMHTDL